VKQAWICQRSGDCCESVPLVLMTPSERDAVIAADPDTLVTWLTVPDARYVAMKAAPCPFLARERGSAVCRIYAARPFSCRRYACGRDDVSVPLSQVMVRNAEAGTVLPMRFYTDRAFRRQMTVQQRKAQRWARAHGWSEAMV
jgi:Fe-S-cluster containining protein